MVRLMIDKYFNNFLFFDIVKKKVLFSRKTCLYNNKETI